MQTRFKIIHNGVQESTLELHSHIAKTSIPAIHQSPNGNTPLSRTVSNDGHHKVGICRRDVRLLARIKALRTPPAGR